MVLPRRVAGRSLTFRGVARALLLRVGAALLVVWGAATLVFITMHAVPGEPEDVILGSELQVTDELRAQVRTDFGLDRPLPEQYLTYLGNLARGDLGTSYLRQQSVRSLILSELGPTVQLAIGGLLVAAVLAVGLAILTTGSRGPARHLVVIVELIAIAAPSYWVGILLLSVFSFQLGWFPAFSDGTVRSLVLPALTMGLALFGLFSQVLREAAENAARQPFTLSARARGLGRWAVTVRHLLAHASIPVLTVGGWVFGGVIGGAVLIETVFGRPGLGRLTLQAVVNQDIPLIVGVVLLSATVFVVLTMVLDVLYRVIDPRIEVAR